MTKFRVVLSGLFYPVAILRYFEAALEHHPDVELITIGPYTGTWIPWGSGMDLPEKYAKSPTIPLNRQSIMSGRVPAGMLSEHELLNDIDLWIQCDAGFYFSTRPPAKHVVHIATDPHVLNYDFQRGISDVFFNMQKVYSKANDIYLPYAASRYHHYPVDVPKKYDVCLVGLQYPNRTNLVNLLRANGISVKYELGLGPDEYRDAYSKSRIAVSWSSLDDLIARVFEAGAFKLPLVTNRVSDLRLHFEEGYDFLGFNTAEEAVRRVKALLDSPLLMETAARNLEQKVITQHTYDNRINQILNEVGLNG